MFSSNERADEREQQNYRGIMVFSILQQSCCKCQPSRLLHTFLGFEHRLQNPRRLALPFTSYRLKVNISTGRVAVRALRKEGLARQTYLASFRYRHIFPRSELT